MKSAEIALNKRNNRSKIGTKVARARLSEKIKVECTDYDMSDVYKIPMLRIPNSRSGLGRRTVEVKELYEGHIERYADVEASLVRFSKNFCYEKPCDAKVERLAGISKLTGPETGS